MLFMRNISIKGKLILIIMLVSSAVLLITCSSIFYYSLIVFRHDTIHDLSSNARMIGANATAAITFDDPNSAEEMLSSLSIKEQVSYACIFGRDGKVFAEYRRDKTDNAEYLMDDTHLSESFHNSHVDINVPIVLDNETIGSVYLRSELGELHARYRDYALMVIGITGACFLIAFVLSSKLQRIVSSPILYLAGIARSIADRKDYSVRAEKYQAQSDEVGQLTKGFNDMLGQIEQRDASLREAHAILETRVEERTAKLREIVSELEQSRHAALSIMEDAEHARKEAELERDKIEAMLRSIGDGVLVVNTDQRILMVNQAGERIMGWANDDIVGRFAEQVFTIINEDSGEKVESPLGKALAENRVIELSNHTALVRKDRSTVPIADSGAPITDKSGKIIGAILVFRDISYARKVEKEKEQLQSQFYQSQKMEGIGILAGGVAHDFNNLLQGILGYTSMMKLRLGNDDENLPHLNLIELAAERAADLTQQLLSFARKGKYNIVYVNPETIVKQVIGLIERTFNRNIQIDSVFDSDLLSIHGEKTQIHQALMNVCINAREAMPKGGKLSITVQNLVLQEEQITGHPGLKPGKYIVFKIQDTGMGMSKETMQRIFEPFFTTKESGKGTGLGLAVSFGVVQNHDGFIEVESELDKGSTFRLYFPAEEQPLDIKLLQPSELEKIPLDVMAISSDFAPENCTILIVDDEEIVNYVAQDMLKAAGFNTFSASNGNDALVIYRERQNEIDAVILDMIMPGMGGLETFRELKKINPNVRVVIASGYEEDERSQEVMREGAMLYLRKPFLIQKLLEAVRMAIGHSSAAESRT